MKHKIVITSAFTLLAASAMAGDNMKITLGGSLEAQYGFIKQKPLFHQLDTKDASKSMRRNNVLVNNGKITLDMKAETENGLKYGGSMDLNANPSSTKSGSNSIVSKSMLFIESNFGKFELGSYDSASGSLAQSAEKIAKGTGGIDGDFKNFVNPKTADGFDIEHLYITGPGMPVGHDTSGSSNKITYYTPKFNGLQLGVSFVPDGGAKGTVNQALSIPSHTFIDTDPTNASADSGPEKLKYEPGYKNVVDASLQHEAKINSLAITSSLSAQVGQSKDEKDKVGTYKRKPLRAWQIGSVATYNGFSLAASYGNWGHSGVYKNIPKNYKRSSAYYTLGTAYEYKNWAASITYLSAYAATGVHGGFEQTEYDKTKALSMAVDYKIIEGLKAYVEVTNFKFSRVNNIANKGTITLIGTKLKF